MIEGKKISQLGTVQTLQDGCCFPVLSRGATKRITFSVLLENIIRRLPDVNQEEFEEIKKKLQEHEAEIEELLHKDHDIDELIRNVAFQIEGQNLTINEYTETVNELNQKIEQTHFDDVLELEEAVRVNTTKINGMYPVIPAEASESNKLTTKSYVDESIQTSSAVNRGNFETYADLMAYSGTVTRNDYATVGDDETHDHEAWRYKWNDDNEEWTPEYRINEAPMTLEQLAALNSGITEELVEQFSGFTNPIDDNAPESTTTTLSAKKINDSLADLESEIEYLSDDDEYVLAQIEYIQTTDGAGYTSPVSPKGNYLSISNCKGILGGSIISPQYSIYGCSLVNVGNMWRVRTDTGIQTVTPMINTPNVKIRLLVYIKKSELI